jgi:hypothetical protein
MTAKTAIRITGQATTRICFIELTYIKITIAEVRKLRGAATAGAGSVFNESPLGSFVFNE